MKVRFYGPGSNTGMWSKGRWVRARGSGKAGTGKGFLAGPWWLCRIGTGGRESGTASWGNCERGLGGRRTVSRAEVNWACLEPECILTAKTSIALKDQENEFWSVIKLVEGCLVCSSLPPMLVNFNKALNHPSVALFPCEMGMMIHV